MFSFLSMISRHASGRISVLKPEQMEAISDISPKL